MRKLFKWLFGWKITHAKLHAQTGALIFHAKRFGYHKVLTFVSCVGNGPLYTPTDHDVIARSFFTGFDKLLKETEKIDNPENLYVYNVKLNHPDKYIVDVETGCPVWLNDGVEDIKAFMVQAYLKYLLKVLTSQRHSLVYKNATDKNERFGLFGSTPNAYSHANNIEMVLGTLKENLSKIKNVKRFIGTYKLFKFTPKYVEGIYSFLIGYNDSFAELKISMVTHTIPTNTFLETRGKLADEELFKRYGFSMDYFMFQYLFLNKSVFKDVGGPKAISPGVEFVTKELYKLKIRSDVSPMDIAKAFGAPIKDDEVWTVGVK